jgi:hypothetical protein
VHVGVCAVADVVRQFDFFTKIVLVTERAAAIEEDTEEPGDR